MAGKEGERVHSPRKALINEVRSSRQAQQTEKEGSYLYLAICMTSYILRHTEIVHLPIASFAIEAIWRPYIPGYSILTCISLFCKNEFIHFLKVFCWMRKRSDFSSLILPDSKSVVSNVAVGSFLSPDRTSATAPSLAVPHRGNFASIVGDRNFDPD